MKLALLIARYDGRCFYCCEDVDLDAKQPAPKAPTRDHFIPISKGGKRGPKNTVLACHRCNADKGNIDPRQAMYLWICLDPSSFNRAMDRLAAQQVRPTRTISPDRSAGNVDNHAI
jgi:hypothetical protein